MSEKGEILKIKKIKIVDFSKPIDAYSIAVDKFCNFFANSFLVE